LIPERYYRILGLTASATPMDVKKAYRNLAKRVHPDLNPSKQANEQFLKIKEAYEIILGYRPLPKTNEVPKQNPTRNESKGSSHKTSEQEQLEKAIRFKIQQECQAKIHFLKQKKRYDSLREGWRLQVFNSVVLLSTLAFLLVAADYLLPSKLTKHRIAHN
jgi:hypothetical protein